MVTVPGTAIISPRMRVCFISKQWSPGGGGSERYAYELSRALGERGHDIDVYCLRGPTSPSGRHTPKNVTVTFLGKRRRKLASFETLYFSIGARYSADFDRYDVLHGTLMPPSTIGLTIRPPSIPTVLTSHGTSFGEIRSHHLEVPSDYLKKFVFHPMNMGMDALAVRQGDGVIAPSTSTKDELVRWYSVSESDVMYIPHGVDIERFSPDVPRHPAVSSNRLTLLHVGRLVSRKRVDLALEAVGKLDQAEVELLVAGGGRHGERLEQRTRQLGVEDAVTFLGVVPESDLPSLYASSDLFLFLSRYEGFGLTFMEALATGTPVLGTAVGGFSDLVTDGREGVWVRPSSAAVARAIQELAANQQMVDEMGGRARELASCHTWKRVAKRVEALYASL